MPIILKKGKKKKKSKKAREKTLAIELEETKA
jgi:hypothetical protein